MKSQPKPPIAHVATHTTKFSAPEDDTSVPLDVAEPTLPPWLFGSHCLPPITRFAAVVNAAKIPMVKEAIAALHTRPENPPDLARDLAKILDGRQEIPSGKCVPGDAPQIILPHPTLGELALTPTGCPAIVDQIIRDLGQEGLDRLRRPPTARKFEAVGKPQNVAGIKRLRGPIYHAIPPVTDTDTREYHVALHQPAAWLRNQLRNQEAFNVFVNHIQEAMALPNFLPAWMRNRGTSLLFGTVNPICSAYEAILGSEASLPDIAHAFVGEVTAQVGQLDESTVGWINKSFNERSQ